MKNNEALKAIHEFFVEFNYDRDSVELTMVDFDTSNKQIFCQLSAGEDYKFTVYYKSDRLEIEIYGPDERSELTRASVYEFCFFEANQRLINL